MNVTIATYTNANGDTRSKYFPTLDEAKLAVNAAAIEAGKDDMDDWYAIQTSASYASFSFGRTKAEVCRALNYECNTAMEF